MVSFRDIEACLCHEPLLENSQAVWDSFDKHKVFDDPAELATLQKYYKKCAHWHDLFFVPSIVSIVWLITCPEALLKATQNNKVVSLGILALTLLVGRAILRRIAGRMFVNDAQVKDILVTHKPGPQMKYEALKFRGRCALGNLLWVVLLLFIPWLRNVQSIFVGFSFLMLIFAPPVFPENRIVDWYAKRFIEKLRLEVQHTHLPKLNFWIQILEKARNLRQTLNTLYRAAFFYHSLDIGVSVGLAIAFAIVGIELARSKHSLGAVLMVAVGSGFHAYTGIIQLLMLASRSDECMSPEAGLLGDILKRGIDLALVGTSEKDLLQFQVLKDEFRFLKFGATVGIVIDQRLIITTVASSAAAFVTFVSKVVQELNQ